MYATGVQTHLCNQQVGGSSPSTSSNPFSKQRTEYGGIPEWPKGADCKSVVSDFGGSNPPSPTKAEPDEPRGRLALLLSLQSIWSAESSFWSVRSTRKNKKEATAQDCSCAVASLCFFIAITDFVIIYQNPARF